MRRDKTNLGTVCTRTTRSYMHPCRRRRYCYCAAAAAAISFLAASCCGCARRRGLWRDVVASEDLSSKGPLRRPPALLRFADAIAAAYQSPAYSYCYTCCCAEPSTKQYSYSWVVFCSQAHAHECYPVVEEQSNIAEDQRENFPAEPPKCVCPPLLPHPNITTAADPPLSFSLFFRPLL